MLMAVVIAVVGLMVLSAVVQIGVCVWMFRRMDAQEREHDARSARIRTEIALGGRRTDGRILGDMTESHMAEKMAENVRRSQRSGV